MKKIILSFSVLIGLNSYSQNTIPTTTCTGAMKINDSLNVNKDIIANGDITSKGEVVATDTLRAKENVIASKDIKVDGSIYVGDKLNVAGQSIFDQEITIKKSILFDGGNELSYTPATATSRPTFYLGNTASKPLPWLQCPNPNTNTSPQFINNGAFISRTPLGSGVGSTNSALTFYSAPWGGSGVIEVDGVDENGMDKNVLLINYFCGRNTFINTNFGLSNSGKVGLGRNVEIGPVYPENLNVTLNLNAEKKDGIKIQADARSKAVVVSTSNAWSESFVVLGDGTTRIGYKKPLAPHDNAMLGVDGKIACKSLYVLKPTSWADFVFKQPKTESLESIAKFIAEHKHLPGIPSEEEIYTNGYDINEMDAKLLEKIESLYLHIIELEKEIKQLKNK